MLIHLPRHRYMSQAKHAEARELMFNGALLFFSYNQVRLRCIRQAAILNLKESHILGSKLNSTKPSPVCHGSN